MDPQTTEKVGQVAHEEQRPAGRTRASSKLNYKQAVLATLAYFDLFEYPLTLEETNRYLFKIEPDPHHIEITLNESQFIEKRGSYYQLIGEKSHIIDRHERALVAKQLWKRVDKFRWILGLVPFVSLIAVCNNLAYNNTDKESDIDLFVVTKPGRMFIARTFLTFWLQIFGIRRHGQKIKGRFCLSFFVTEKALDFEPLQKEPIDIYLAYWFQTLKPITGDLEIYDKFLTENERWLNKFFVGPLHPNMHRFKESPDWVQYLKKWQEKLLNSKWGDKLEAKLEQWQLKRAQKKLKNLLTEEKEHGIILFRHMLKFHNVDRRTEYYRAWGKKLKEIT